MEIYFKTSHKSDVQEVTPRITSLATKKLNGLKKYLEHRKNVARVYVELGKVSEAHQQGNIWQAQVNLDCDGERFHAGSTGENLESAIATAITELEREIKKARQYHHTMLVKGGGVLKELVRGLGEFRE